MFTRKRLAHGNHRRLPTRIKKLAYSVAFAAAMPLLASCVQARVSSVPVVRKVVKKCTADMKHLRAGERAIRTVCKYGRKYIMTKNAIVMVPGEKERVLEDSWEGKVVHESMRLDIRWNRERGVASWVPSKDSIFILMKNSMLARYVLDSDSENGSGYIVPFSTRDLKQDSMAYFRKMIFIVSRTGKIFIASFSDSKARVIDSKQRDSGFFIENGRLFLGKKEGKIEIKVGKDLSAVALR